MQPRADIKKLNLLAGVAVLAWMAWRLLEQMQRDPK